MKAEVFDSRVCQLGEGPLWHPERQQFFWFDILGKRLLSRMDTGPMDWQFDEYVSAAGWIDKDTLLIASETALWSFDLERDEQTFLHALEAENTVTRSNDGRADPWGGFWIGSMGKETEPGAGSIYRLYRGELRKLVHDITVSNAICFAPDRSCAYYTNSPDRRVMRVPLDPDSGWPDGEATVHLDLTQFGSAPDGAVTDAQGNIWLACWGGAMVACYAPDGTLITRVQAPARQTSCPAFGGADLRDLYITSAATGLIDSDQPHDGCTFVLRDATQGVAEPRVHL